MARNGDITLGWADGEYHFRLAWGQLVALQEACDAGPGEILQRLTGGRWRVQDLEQTILQGLIGGGMEAAQARKLVQSYVRESPLNENVLVAISVLMAALNGAPPEDDDAPGKPDPAGATDAAPCPPAS